MRQIQTPFTGTPTTPEVEPVLCTERALLREPNLWTPGKKPVGPVKVDWGHPMANGLMCCFVYFDSIYQAVNLVDGYAWPVAEFANSSNDKNNYVSTDDTKERFNGRITDAVADYAVTIHGIVKISHFTTSQNVFSKGTAGTSTNSYDLKIHPSPDDVRFSTTVSASQDNLDGTGLTTGWHTLTNTWIHGKKKQIYYDGKLNVESASAYNGPLDNTDAQAMLLSQESTDSWQGECETCFVWNRGMTAEEIWSLYLDPYQFLIPA